MTFFRPIVATLTLLLASAPPAPGAPTAAAVSCGASADITIEDGSVYRADQVFNGTNGYGAIGGQPFSPHIVITYHLLANRPPLEMELYRDQRVGPAGYVFELPDTLYEMTVHLGTFQRNGVGDALMSVVAEGDTILEDFDVITEVGMERPADIRSLVDLSDGELNIDFYDSRGDHDISAIGLRVADPDDATPPATPTGLEALDTYAGVLLRWNRNTETDLLGYRVFRDDGLGWVVERDLRRVPMVVPITQETTRYGVIAIDLYGNESDTTFTSNVGPRDPWSLPLQRYEIFVDPLDLLLLDEDIFADIEVWGTLFVGGAERDSVSLSYRGNSSRPAPKKSWNIDLEGNSPLHGGNDLILKSTFIDKTIQRELLSTDLLALAGVAHPTTFPVRVELNGEYRGVHLDVERINESFVARVGWDAKGRLYRADSALSTNNSLQSYIDLFEPQLVDDWERADAIALTDALVRLPDEDILPWLEASVDLESYLSLLCHHQYAANKDWVGDDYFLYRADPDSPWRIVPWDMHESWDILRVDSPITFGTEETPDLVGRYNRLLNRILHVPSLQRRYTERFREYLASHMHADSILAAFDARESELFEDMNRDVYKATRELSAPYVGAVESVRDFIEARYAEVETQLDAYELPEHVLVHMSELVPTAGHSVHGVEILNLAARPFELSEFYLSDDRADLSKWALPDTILAGQDRVAFSLGSPASRGSWIGLSRLVESSTVVVDSIVAPSFLPATRSYGRYPDSSGRWRYLDYPSPGASNTWNSPIAVELDVSDTLLVTGQPIQITIGLENDEFVAITGTARLALTSWEGIRYPQDPLWTQTIEVPAIGATQLQINAAVPSIGLDAGGYVLSAAFLYGDDLWAVHERELFVLGDPVYALVVNEVMARNDTTLADEAGEYDDWIELYNTSDQSVPLAGLFLTDDLQDDPYRWPLPSQSLAPYEHRVVWCDNDVAQGDFHASFKLSGGGEEVAITSAGPEPVVVDRWVFGAQEADVASGRYPDGQPTWLRQGAPTPGAVNVYSPR